MGRQQKVPKFIKCLDILNQSFKDFEDPRAFSTIDLKDFLLSSYAVFFFKYPSLLSFENDMFDESKFENLRNLFDIDVVPSDTHLRDVMDELDYKQFRVIFKKLFALIQRSKLFESYEFIRHRDLPYYLISLDGSGYFRSDKVGCSRCIQYEGSEKRRMKKFGHNILGACLVHPTQSQVFPLCPEPIFNADGATKNDCEQNAFKRFIKDFRREHPKLDVVFTLDALYAGKPFIDLLCKHDCSFIIAVKETKSALFMRVNEDDGKTHFGEYAYQIGQKVIKQVTCKYRFRKNVQLHQDSESPFVNFFEFWEETSWEGKKGPQVQKRHFSWITDLEVNHENIKTLITGGRARWKIENETFNTLKNQGYHLEHNFGHGKKNLSVNFIMMMFIAFFIDQIQMASCQQFKRIMKRYIRKSYVWNYYRENIRSLVFKNWEEFYGLLTGDYKIQSQLIDSS